MITPARKRMRLEGGGSSSDGMLLEPSATIKDLPSEVMKNLFSFVGKGNYYFVAPVSKDFCYNYLTFDVIEDKFAHKMDCQLAIGKNKVTTAEAASSSFELAECSFLKAPENFQEGIVREAIRKGKVDIVELGQAMGIDIKEVMSCSFRFRARDIVRRGDLEMLKLLQEKGAEFKLLTFISNIISVAAYNGQLQILKWLHEHNLCESSEDQTAIFTVAARSDRLSIIKWAKEVAGFNCPSDLINTTVENGNLEIVKYLRSKNMPWDDLTFGAASRSGNIALLQYLLENKCPHDDPWICTNAIQKKDHENALEVLEWLHDKGIPWDEETCEMAVEQANLKALKFARLNGCPWNEECLEIAVHSCNLEVIEYCLQSGCPGGDSWNIYLFFLDDKDHDQALRILKLLRKFSVPWNKELCNKAASAGNLTALKWAISQGCPWDKEKSAYGAAKLRNTEALNWIISQGCELNEQICANAALSGNLETSKWLISLGCPYNVETSFKAIQSGNHAIVEYCIENDFPFTEELYEYTVDYFRDPFPLLKLFQKKQYSWNSSACKAAARAGDLKLLRWLRFQGCPWDEETCHQAVNYDNLDILKYAHENGCEWTKETYAYCFSQHGLFYETEEIPTDHQCPDQIIEYLQIHNCPQPNPDDWYTFSD